MALRFNKSELAFESPRLWQWEDCLKVLYIAALAYAFLLSLCSGHSSNHSGRGSCPIGVTEQESGAGHAPLRFTDSAWLSAACGSLIPRLC